MPNHVKDRFSAHNPGGFTSYIRLPYLVPKINLRFSTVSYSTQTFSSVLKDPSGAGISLTHGVKLSVTNAFHNKRVYVENSSLKLRSNECDTLKKKRLDDQDWARLIKRLITAD